MSGFTRGSIRANEFGQVNGPPGETHAETAQAPHRCPRVRRQGRMGEIERSERFAELMRDAPRFRFQRDRRSRLHVRRLSQRDQRFQPQRDAFFDPIIQPDLNPLAQVLGKMLVRQHLNLWPQGADAGLQ